MKGRFDSYFSIVSDYDSLEDIARNTICQLDIFMSPIRKNCIVYLINTDKREIVRMKEAFIKVTLETGYRLGMSGVYYSVRNVPEMIMEAQTSFYQYFICEDFRAGQYEKEKYETVKLLMDEFLTTIDSGNASRNHKLIDEITVFFRRHGLGMQELVTLYNYITGLLIKAGVDRLQDMGIPLYQKDADSIVEEYESIDKMVISLHQKVNSIFNADPLASCNSLYPTNKTVIAAIMEYIDRNYRKNITLSHLARKFHIDERYLSQLFKAETGRTLVDYITSARIKHACILLKETFISIQDISELCGYKDYFYFNKVFKKTMNTTPSLYRNSNR